MGKRVEGPPDVAKLIGAQASNEPGHLREVVAGRGRAGNQLLSLDPDIDRLYVGTSDQALLGETRLGHTVDLRDCAVISGVAGGDVGAVLEPVLLVAAVSQCHRRDEAIRRVSSTRIVIHGVQVGSSSSVGDKANELGTGKHLRVGGVRRMGMMGG